MRVDRCCVRTGNGLFCYTVVMRIAMIGQKGIPMGEDGGGIEKHVEELSARLVRRGHSVLVYVRPWYSIGTGLSFHGVHLRRVPSIRTKHLDTITHTFFASIDVCLRGVDVVHYHGVGPSTLSWIPQLFSRAKVVTTFHSQDRFHKKWGFFSRLFLHIGEWTAVRLAERTIAVSQMLQSYIATHYRATSVYIPNGVSMLPAPPVEVLKEFGVTGQGYILAVARLVRHKGLHTLIQAFRNMETEKKLIIVGSSAFTDDYARELAALAADDSRVLLAGFQGGRTLAALYAHAALYVNPSESEGLSLAILEAMSFGIPVLVSDIPENKEAVNGCGYTFRSRDVADLTDQMNLLLADPEQMRSMGVCGRDFIRTHFDWDTITNKTAVVYGQL